MNTIVVAVIVLAILPTVSFLAAFIIGWAATIAAIDLPAPVVILPARLSSDKDPGRILRQPLLQEKSPELAAWLEGSETCDRLHRQRKGHTVWGQPQMFRTAIHHPIMRVALVKNVTGITRHKMGAWHVKQQAQFAD